MHPVAIPGFELERRLGAGGMAEVFLARKEGAEGTFKQLVLKRILPKHSKSRRFRHMFVEEANLATRLNHPNIVQVYEFSQDGAELFLSMEYVEGVDLGKLMRAAADNNENIPPWVAAFIASQVAKGLHYAHEREDEVGFPLAIVHRDVSPQNVLVGYGGVVKIADFGIASANLFREEKGVLKGKYGYMSPEQARGEKVDRRSDIYALGVVLYEMLTGHSPYGDAEGDALSEAVREGRVQETAIFDDTIEPKLAAITKRAMAPRADDRFESARQMAAALARALLEEQQLVDDMAVEDTMSRLLGQHREEEASASAPPRTMAAVRKPRTSGEQSAGTSQVAQSVRVVREVRHVTVIKLRLEGVDALKKAQGSLGAGRTLAATRRTLEDIAYKHEAVWSWADGSEAYAVVGLMANPSRAPNDAALIAVDTHEFLASHSGDLPVPLRASIAIVRGIAAGERDRQGHLQSHTLHPPADYLAEQLGRRTPFGKTWAAGGVFRLVRREFRWSDGPGIELADAEEHNVPERMRVYALLRPLTGDERMAEMALSPTDLVGRDAEKADLHAAYHRAVYHPGMSTPPPPDPGSDLQKRLPRAREGELLARVVVGEMGIGKTALIDTFVGELPEDARQFRVECSPVKLDLPFATVSDMVCEVAGIAADDGYDKTLSTLSRLCGKGRIVGRHDPVPARLAELVTARQITLQDEDAATLYHNQILEGVRRIFGAIALETPVVAVVDGLQWADRASLELITRLLEKPEPLPVLILLVTRPDDRVDPYLEGLMRTELRGLSAAEQIRLVQARLGVGEGVASVCRELLPRVGGNPFFLLELIDALLERGALEISEPDDGREPFLLRNDEKLDALPHTVEQLVGDRLAELPPAEHDVVDWLAVAGGPLSEPDLMNLTRLADDEAITRLCARGLCDRRGKTIDFRHPLARDVAYNALAPVQRVRMHRRLGEHLANSSLARGLSAAIVAKHLEQGEAPRHAAEHYLEAASAARYAHQAQLAIRYFLRTLELLPAGDDRRLKAHEALERIYRQVGQGRERQIHLDHLKRLAHDSRQARWLAVALVRSAQLDLDEGALDNGLPAAQRAADMARFAKMPDLEVEALIILCELLRDLGDVNGALDASERALVVASSNPVSRRARAEILRAKGVLLRRAGRVSDAIQTHAEAIAMFHLVGARRGEARARNALGFALFVLGRYEDCIAMCLSSIAIDVQIGGRFQVAKTLSNIGMAYARLGDAERGLAYLTRAREAHERYNDKDGRLDTLLVTASTLLERDEVAAARHVFGDAAALGSVGSNIYDRIHQLIVCALIARAEGDGALAAAEASKARQLAEGQALVSYHVYATSIEAAIRVDAGDNLAGLKLATTALGAVEMIEGSEYGVEIRSLCCDAVLRASENSEADQAASTLAADVCRRAVDHVNRTAGFIRDPQLHATFFARPAVKKIVDHAARQPDAGERRQRQTSRPPEA